MVEFDASTTNTTWKWQRLITTMSNLHLQFSKIILNSALKYNGFMLFCAMNAVKGMGIKMKEYKRPEMIILSYVSKETISSGSLSDWLEEQPDFSGSSIYSYDITSIENEIEL